jgi:EAL domain-containing protein (putative c-di-GMP-specific phosphodiesterase class I)
MPPPTPTTDFADPSTVARIDRITRDLLSQLELQTQVVLNLLEQAPTGQREALLEQLAELRGCLVRLRAKVLGAGRPQLALARTRDGRG